MNERQRAPRSGFTLIEMMVVIVIIAILAGLVFKLMRPSADKLAKVETVARLEQLKAAIEEFYADYGQYPPVPLDDDGEQPLRFEYPHREYMRADLAGRFSDSEERLVTFGLMAFLLKRWAGHAEHAWPRVFEEGYGEKQWFDHNDQTNDQPRDARFAERVEPFLDGIIHHGQAGHTIVPNNPGTAYTNLTRTVLDGWGQELLYRSKPPHQSYLLFSKGPDGDYDPEDPGNRDIEVNKDNIYGHVGH